MTAITGHLVSPEHNRVVSNEIQGLTSSEAADKLRQFGQNLVPRPKAKSLWRRLASQMVHFFALMLWVAGVLAIVAGMSQLGVAIFVVIVINGLFAFVQEYRAERATERLRDLLPRKTSALRDGNRKTIPVEQLVPGDIVFLSAGDRVSADLVLL